MTESYMAWKLKSTRYVYNALMEPALAHYGQKVINQYVPTLIDLCNHPVQNNFLNIIMCHSTEP